MCHVRLSHTQAICCILVSGNTKILPPKPLNPENPASQGSTRALRSGLADWQRAHQWQQRQRGGQQRRPPAAALGAGTLPSPGHSALRGGRGPRSACGCRRGAGGAGQAIGALFGHLVGARRCRLPVRGRQRSGRRHTCSAGGRAAFRCGFAGLRQGPAAERLDRRPLEGAAPQRRVGGVSHPERDSTGCATVCGWRSFPRAVYILGPGQHSAAGGLADDGSPARGAAALAPGYWPARP